MLEVVCIDSIEIFVKSIQCVLINSLDKYDYQCNIPLMQLEQLELLSHIGSQFKRRQSQSYKFKEFAKISNLAILKQTLHATHILKLLDTICKYEMDPTRIVEDTERTRFCPQTDRRTDKQTDKVKPAYPSFNFVEAGA